MVIIISDKQVKARKQHKCCFCYGVIEVGEIHNHQVNKIDECNGTGMSSSLMTNYGKCHACKGFGMIDELTGLPPKANTTSSTSTNFSSGDFRDDSNMESQQEYFGQK